VRPVRVLVDASIPSISTWVLLLEVCVAAFPSKVDWADTPASVADGDDKATVSFAELVNRTSSIGTVVIDGVCNGGGRVVTLEDVDGWEGSSVLVMRSTGTTSK